jgi:hypothetical protein
MIADAIVNRMHGTPKKFLSESLQRASVEASYAAEGA